MGRPKEQQWPIISPRRNQKEEITSWTVDCGMLNARRVRFSFKTRAEAEGKATLMRAARRNEGDGAFSMVIRDRVDAESALKLLEPHGVTLRQAAEFYLANMDVIAAKKTFSQVLADLLLAKAQDGKSARYLQDIRNRLTVAETQFGSRVLYEVKKNELDDWLRQLPGSSTNRNNFRRLLSVLFGYAQKRGYILRNPVKDVAIANVERGKPQILTLAESRALMLALEPELIPAVALALFGGLRPESEILAPDHPLDWSQIELDDPEHRVIDVQESKTVDSQRYVEISDNLAAWLRPHRKTRGPVCSIAYYDRLRGARQRAMAALGEVRAPHLADWPNDVLRHSFASNLYALTKDAHKTSEQLGHYGGVRIFLRHYKGRVRYPDAMAFWQILPSPSELAG